MSLKAFKEPLQTCSPQRIRTAITPGHSEPEAEPSVTRKPPKLSLRDQFAGLEHFLKPLLPSTSSPARATPLQHVESDEPAVTRKPPKFSFRDQFAGLDHFLNPKPPLPSSSSPAPAALRSNSAAPDGVRKSRTKRSFSQDVELQRCGSGVSRVAEEDVAKVANEEDAANVRKRRKVESVTVEPAAAEDETLHDSEAGLFIQSEREGPYEPLVLEGTSCGDRVMQVPVSINSRLLAHLRDGVKFLYNLYRESRGGILGDDMEGAGQNNPDDRLDCCSPATRLRGWEPLFYAAEAGEVVLLKRELLRRYFLFYAPPCSTIGSRSFKRGGRSGWGSITQQGRGFGQSPGPELEFELPPWSEVSFIRHSLPRRVNAQDAGRREPSPATDLLRGHSGSAREAGGTAVTPEGAALMQSAEARTYGKTQKDGAAAEQNVRAGFVKPGDHSLVAQEGVVPQHILVPGAAIDLEYIAGQPVMESVKPMPTDCFIATSQAVTIGNALEGAALAGNRPVGKSDARAIQSAVMRATGAPTTAGGLAAAAMAAAEMNARVPSVDKTTLADILMDASTDLDSDKIATQEDAAKVLHAELRGSPTGEPQLGGVAAALQVAANINDYAGLIDGHFRPVVSSKDTTFPEQEHDVSAATENVPTAGGELHAKVD